MITGGRNGVQYFVSRQNYLYIQTLSCPKTDPGTHIVILLLGTYEHRSIYETLKLHGNGDDNLGRNHIPGQKNMLEHRQLRTVVFGVFRRKTWVMITHRKWVTIKPQN